MQLGNIPYLSELHLDMNRLDLLPESLVKLRQLAVFSCSLNQLYAIPAGMGRLEKLKVVSHRVANKAEATTKG